MSAHVLLNLLNELTVGVKIWGFAVHFITFSK